MANIFDQFKVGDIVRLKSGGPKLVVEGIDTFGGEIKFSCVWFDANHLLQRSNLHPILLVKVEVREDYLTQD